VERFPAWSWKGKSHRLAQAPNPLSRTRFPAKPEHRRGHGAKASPLCRRRQATPPRSTCCGRSWEQIHTPLWIPYSTEPCGCRRPRSPYSSPEPSSGKSLWFFRTPVTSPVDSPPPPAAYTAREAARRGSRDLGGARNSFEFPRGRGWAGGGAARVQRQGRGSG
jgi:hypothetical protein